MKEKINKLLDSRDLDNILLGIHLAYKLPIEDFEELFKQHRKTGYKEYNHYKFCREDIWYIMGRGYIVRTNHAPSIPKISIDITPENYE